MNHKSGNGHKTYGLNIGSSSILLIFVVLCLISFATLSIVSANADNKLTQKVLDRTTAYYEACNQAERALAEVDATLVSVYSSSETEEEYFAVVGHGKSFAVPISDLQTLQVTIDFLYPVSDEEPFYRISDWKVITTGELE